MKFSKSKFNLVIDIIMFLVLMAIVGIGLLIKYVLVPGTIRNELYGKNTELFFLNLDRHQWGSIHLVLGFIMLFLLILHIYFHWNMIVCIFRNMVQSKKNRIILTGSLVLITVILALMPLFIKPEVRKEEPEKKHQRQSHFNENAKSNSGSLKLNNNTRSNSGSPKLNNNTRSKNEIKESKNHDEYSNIEVQGYMTLNEVSQKYNIPVEKLASHLNVPVKYKNERLGRLRKQYGFRLSELKSYIQNRGTN